MTLPAEGWFPDPQDASRLRWWDGRTWGGSTQPAPRSLGGTAVLVETSDTPRFSVDVAAPADHGWACGSGAGSVALVGGGVVGAVAVRRFCLFGWGSLVLAIVSAVLDPMGLMGIAAIAVAIVGVVHPRGTGRWRTAGRSLSISAIVLAIATTLGTVADSLPLLGLHLPL